jgi:hypothetical protein
MLHVYVDATRASSDDASGCVASIDVAQVVPLRIAVANVGDVDLPSLTLDVKIAKVRFSRLLLFGQKFISIFCCFVCFVSMCGVHIEFGKRRTDTGYLASRCVGWTRKTNSMSCLFHKTTFPLAGRIGVKQRIRLHTQAQAVVVRALKVGEVYQHSIRVIAALAGIYELQATLRSAPFERHMIPEASSKDAPAPDIIYNISTIQLIAR